LRNMRNYSTRHENVRNDTTLVLDCSYLCYQAWYTMRELSFDGLDTGIIFGFLSRVLHLATQFNTSDIHFCWDSRHSYRKVLLPSYKEHRHAKISKAELAAKVKAKKIFTLLRKEILPAIGLVQNHVQKGCEADDLIAAIVQGRMGSFVIVSADEDLFQLLAANVKMYNPTKKIMWTPARLREEKYTSPDQWAKLKCLMGCQSDNVKGIKGVGFVYATKYLKKVLTWGSRAERLIKEGEKDAYDRNWILVKLPFPKTREPKNLHARNTFNEPAFIKLCKKYGMKSFMAEDKLAEWRTAWKI